MNDPLVRRLMTLPGVDMHVASGVAAAIGDIRLNRSTGASRLQQG